MNSSDIIPEAIRVLELEGNAILECSRRLRAGEASKGFTQTVEWCRSALDQGGKVVITGIGKSGKIGQKIAATLCSTGSLAVYLHPTEGLHGDLGLIRSGDVVIALSYTGNTEEVVRLVPILKSRGAKVVGLGGNPHSKLAHECDSWIDAEVQQEACPHNLAPTTSTTLALALGDALAVALMGLRGFNAKSFAENHPGGSIGKKLSLKVADLLIPLTRVASVAPDALIDEVIQLATRKQLGAVLVVVDSQLVGIITDGDIRRSLSHREGFFQLKAKEIMTRSPIVARPDMMASEALRLMEDRPSQISVLPVVDPTNHALGLLRLHDLVQSF
jgi:arabinose-5-phosphate isomerase